MRICSIYTGIILLNILYIFAYHMRFTTFSYTNAWKSSVLIILSIIFRSNFELKRNKLINIFPQRRTVTPKPIVPSFFPSYLSYFIPFSRDIMIPISYSITYQARPFIAARIKMRNYDNNNRGTMISLAQVYIW